MDGQTYDDKAQEYIREKARETSKKYYDEHRDELRTRARERYRAKKGEVGKPGRKPGTKFPGGYKKSDYNGALKSPESTTDIIFEEVADDLRASRA